MTDLNTLNTLRLSLNMKPLKAWKESKAKLADAIAKLTAKGGTEKIANIGGEIVRAKSAEVKSTGTSISDIAKSLNISDKVARAKLRRRDDVPRLPGKQWVFAAKDVELVKSILRHDNRKKEA